MHIQYIFMWDRVSKYGYMEVFKDQMGRGKGRGVDWVIAKPRNHLHPDSTHPVMVSE